MLRTLQVVEDNTKALPSLRLRCFVVRNALPAARPADETDACAAAKAGGGGGAAAVLAAAAAGAAQEAEQSQMSACCKRI